MSRLTRQIAAGAMMALVCGCADQSPSTSHVTGATFRDASALTVFIADILANSMDGPNSIIRLVQYDGPDPNHTEVLLMDTLRERGFALSPDGMSYPGAHTVRYSVSPVGQNLLLELDADDAEATCLYGHNADGVLERAGSCTIHNGQLLTLKIPNTDQIRAFYYTANANPNILVGAVVGGPNQNDFFPDERTDYSHSEPATYINAAIVGPLAYFAGSQKAFDISN